MTVLAMITASQSLERILSHFDMPTHPPPIAPARLEAQLGLDIAADDVDYDVCQDVPSPTTAHSAARGPP